jgi:hypothetical protein
MSDQQVSGAHAMPATSMASRLTVGDDTWKKGQEDCVMGIKET